MVPSQVHNLVHLVGGAIAFLEVPLALFERVYDATPEDAIALRRTVCRDSFRVGDECYLAYHDGTVERFLSDCGTCAADFYDTPAIRVRHEDLPMHLDYRAAPCVLCGVEGDMIQCKDCRAPYHRDCVLRQGLAARKPREGRWRCPMCAERRAAYSAPPS